MCCENNVLVLLIGRRVKQIFTTRGSFSLSRTFTACTIPFLIFLESSSLFTQIQPLLAAVPSSSPFSRPKYIPPELLSLTHTSNTHSVHSSIAPPPSARA